MVEVLRKEFAEYNLTYSIGGQISFDVFPQVRRRSSSSGDTAAGSIRLTVAWLIICNRFSGMHAGLKCML